MMKPLMHFDPMFAVNDPMGWVENLADRSITIALLAVAVYFVGKRLLATMEDKDKLFRERISGLEANVQQLLVRVNDCEDDRRKLHERLEQISNKPHNRS